MPWVQEIVSIFSASSIRWSEKAFREFKRRVKLLTGGSWFVSMDYRLTELAQHLAWSSFPGEAWQ